MKIVVNGEERELEREVTLSVFVDRLDLSGRPFAIELNRLVIPRSRFEEVTLRDGDILEVVTFVGGG